MATTRAKADPDAGREVRWTKTAIDDLQCWRVTKEEWRAIRSEVERVAKLHHLCLDSAVMRVAQTDGDWLRIKITRPAQIRVFVTEERNPPRLVVQAVLRRGDNTYNIAEIYFNVWKEKTRWRT